MFTRGMKALNPLNALAKAMEIPIKLCEDGEEGNLDLNSMHKYLLSPCWGKIDEDPVNTSASTELADPTDRGGKIFIRNFSGKRFIIEVPSFRLVVCGLKEMIMEQEKGLDLDQLRLIFQGKNMEDHHPLAFYEICSESTIHMAGRLRGGRQWSLDPSVFLIEQNCDFTQIVDKKLFERGGFPYIRPCGWFRIGLDVYRRYGSQTWLEGSKKRRSKFQSAPDEWPVSYHGTSRHNGLNIAQEGFRLTKGFRFTFGKGIYSSPDPNVAMKFAKKYIHHDGCTYRIILQNRVNPASLIVMTNEQTGNNGDYWIVPNEEDIRPYGLCLQKVDPDRKAKLIGH